MDDDQQRQIDEEYRRISDGYQDDIEEAEREEAEREEEERQEREAGNRPPALPIPPRVWVRTDLIYLRFAVCSAVGIFGYGYLQNNGITQPMFESLQDIGFIGTAIWCWTGYKKDKRLQTEDEVMKQKVNELTSKQ